jgi:hypothetical protein
MNSDTDVAIEITTDPQPISPKIILIVPYRDREVHREIFIKWMALMLQDEDYNILFIHQKDTRPFNRGAVKNLGFIYVKERFPDTYKDITLVFNDIDTMPWKKEQFNYSTEHNIIKHYYGFKYALGGIFSIKAGDFEKINGFPNIWTWGLEDNEIQRRALVNNIVISRDKFIQAEPTCKNIIRLDHGSTRLVSNNIYTRLEKYKKYGVEDGINTIKTIRFDEKLNELDDKCYEVNVNYFETNEGHESPFVSKASEQVAATNTIFTNTINNMHKVRARTIQEGFGKHVRGAFML